MLVGVLIALAARRLGRLQQYLSLAVLLLVAYGLRIDRRWANFIKCKAVDNVKT
jgi:hypothetical protein